MLWKSEYFLETLTTYRGSTKTIEYVSRDDAKVLNPIDGILLSGFPHGGDNKFAEHIHKEFSDKFKGYLYSENEDSDLVVDGIPERTKIVQSLTDKLKSLHNKSSTIYAISTSCDLILDALQDADFREASKIEKVILIAPSALGDQTQNFVQNINR